VIGRLRAGLIFLLVLSAGQAQLQPATADHGPHSYSAISGSVLTVLPTWPGYNRPGFGAPPGTAPEGTGFVITAPTAPTDNSRYLLTAAHVIDRATRIEVVSPEGQRRDVRLLASDPQTDLALLEMPFALPAVDLHMKTPQIGEHVCVAGNSFGLGISFSCGVVSATGRSGIGFNPVEDFIQTDAAVNPGASGGLLVNAAGQAVGLVDAIFTKSEDSDAGVNFAVSAALINQVLMKWEEQADVFTH